MKHNAIYDYMRLLAAFGIMLFHSGGPGASIGYAALPFFLMLLLVFSVPSATKQRFSAYALSRGKRLLFPWLIWSGLYAGLKLLEVSTTSASLRDEFSIYMLLTGPALHLWFLPFAFAACLLAYPIANSAKTLKQQSNGFLYLFLAVLIGLALAAHFLRQEHIYSIPIAQWLYALPAVFLGICFAITQNNIRLHFFITGSFLLIAGTAGWPAGLLQLGIAGIVFSFCGMIYLHPNQLSQMCARTSLGVYLAHPLVFSTLDRLSGLHKGGLTFLILSAFFSFSAALIWNKIEHSLTRNPAPS